MQAHVVSDFHPADIMWWLSLSGGKDSYSMAVGLREWYRLNSLPFHATVFLIDQWGGPAASSLARQLDWADVTILDGRSLTSATTRYQPGDQAPCRPCADVRRVLTDALLREHPQRTLQATPVNFVARGLHLSDTAVSAAWRFVMARNPAGDLLSSGKATPISQLTTSSYLVKPLSYAREFESQAFASQNGFTAACCGCPACRFPSRRDIAEETVIRAYRGPLWEFDVPGVCTLIEDRYGSEILAQARTCSAPGLEVKHQHLPEEFFEFSVEYYRSRLRKAAWETCTPFDNSACLDEIGLARIQNQESPINSGNTLPVPALLGLDNSKLIKYRRMIAALGPFWGAFALDRESYNRALVLQQHLFGITIDDRWSHVTTVLQHFYRSKHAIEQNPKKLALHTLPVLDSCICGT